MNGRPDLARDPSLPARAGDAFLCPDADEALLARVVRHLSLRDGPRPVAAHMAYARWKPHVSLTALYRIEFDEGASSYVTWKKYADGKAREIARSYSPDRRAEAQATRLAAFAAPAEDGLCLYGFPTDRELPGLARVLSLRRTARHLNVAELWPGESVRARDSRAELVRYKPEHRAVLRLDLATTREDGARARHRIAVRVLSPGAGARVVAARNAYMSSPNPVLAPRLLTTEERTGLLFEEWLDGESCRSGDFREAEAAGTLLAQLHRSPPPPAPTSEARANSRAELAALFAVDAELEKRFAELPLEQVAAPITWIHGDFHPDQLLCTPAGARVLLDWDALRPGHPVEDLATWIADEIAADPTRDLARAGRPLLAAYARAGGEAPSDARLRAQVGTELARRAAAGLRRIEAQAIPRARSLLDAARTLLQPTANPT